ncbi:sigma-70 family RNA polymerase sigma factor [Lysinibacillus sp. CNPSo 3705]|uniref:sigma-70 family RNA polymerase sigma factor n=1 Tax=Lysinibacillus sp. CNPSo 3705 TaxID=3028148 RepID=UPI002363B818|nr:sigma-70 family RNA polymerase sigma factor [Lysinibacillus sp. CNPSo 3705]MDD1505404.1 sigma-70 family RNA polymerase sigma factor [Lysinibacillus sp. CNPSo 3705]
MDIKSKLVKRAKKGDTEAFQMLIHEEKEKMYRTAYVYMRNENDALEVFQESLYKALNSIQTLKNNDYFSTWLMRILINTAIATLNKKQKIVPISNEMFDQIGDVKNIQSEEHLDLLQAMDEIEEKYKTVLLLRFYHDFTVKQIATFLDCPEGTVKTNIRRGLEGLRLKLKGVYLDDRQNSIV